MCMSSPKMPDTPPPPAPVAAATEEVGKRAGSAASKAQIAALYGDKSMITSGALSGPLVTAGKKATGA